MAQKRQQRTIDARSAARIKEYNTELTPTTVGRCVWEPLSLSLDARDTMVNWLLPVDFVAVMTVSDKIGIEKPPFSSPRKNKKQVHTTGDPSATTSSSFLSLSLSLFRFPASWERKHHNENFTSTSTTLLYQGRGIRTTLLSVSNTSSA